MPNASLVAAAAEGLPNHPQISGPVSSLLRMLRCSMEGAIAPDSTYREDHPAMNVHLNRRAILSASAAAAAGVATAGALATEALADRHWEQVERETGRADLDRLIDVHRKAHRAFNDICYFDDELALGRKATRQETRLLAAADRVEEKAFIAICAYRCASIDELQAKTSYIHAHVEGGDWLQENHIWALLKSSLPVKAARKARRKGDHSAASA